MAKQVNIGFIGTSWWSELIFLPILQNHDRANLVAICGRNQERASEVASRYEIPDVYSDYRKMFQNSELDAVIISTPDDTHYEMAMAAFDAGLHVLCEKPVALNANDALEMLNKAESTGLKHMVMYTHHWFPYLQRVKQLLEENTIGKVYHGQFNWFASYALSGDYAWRFDKARANGIVGDLGSHLIHLSQWYLGKVVSVMGQLGSHVARKGQDGKALDNPANDTTQFMVKFENGAQVQFYISATAQRHDEFMKLSLNLYGEKGMLEAGWIAGQNERTWVKAQQVDSEAIDETLPIDFAGHFDKNPVGARLFVDSILEDKAISPGLKEGYEVQRIIDAVIESHETGRRVMIGD